MDGHFLSSSKRTRRCFIARTSSPRNAILGAPAGHPLPGCFCFTCSQVLSCCCNKPSKAKAKGTCLRSNSANLHGLRVWPECVRFGGGSKQILLVKSADPELSKPAGQPRYCLRQQELSFLEHFLCQACAEYYLINPQSNSVFVSISQMTQGGVTCPRTQVVFKVPFNY